MSKVKVLILRTAGTNCDKETAFAFESAGASVDFIHINQLSSGRRSLDDYKILAIPGGFTYGDDIASGKILANELKFSIESSLELFIKSGRLIIGICNGFQVLVKAGLLPNLKGKFGTIESTLTLNDSNKFEDRWVYLKPERTRCIWTRGMGKVISLPVAHGEGKFVPRNHSVLAKLKRDGLIALRYCDGSGRRAGYPLNPNGAVDDIAGICDPTGRIFGLMPHPERHLSVFQHPEWTRRGIKKGLKGDGFGIFKNGVDFAKIYL
jgi:phosphoribosylformylglycinamidine synthase